jgi:hypothetical protein
LPALRRVLELREADIAAGQVGDDFELAAEGLDQVPESKDLQQPVPGLEYLDNETLRDCD